MLSINYSSVTLMIYLVLKGNNAIYILNEVVQQVKTADKSTCLSREKFVLSCGMSFMPRWRLHCLKAVKHVYTAIDV